MTKTFEMSKRVTKNGRRKFKAILCEVYDDSTIDTENEVGTRFNENGISFIRSCVESRLDTIEGMSLRCEFADEDRTELLGHGETGIEDGVPIFEDATVIGVFSKGYIEDVDLDGEKKSFLIGEGTIDAMCYNNLCKKLDRDIVNGTAPSGSIEIYRTEGNDGIVYLYGYKPEGRIPSDFIFSGYALLGVRPADAEAKLLELNEKTIKEDTRTMNENEIKSVVSQVVAELNSQAEIVAQCKAECEAKVSEANELVTTANTEKDAAIANSEKIQVALDAAQAELDEKYDEIQTLHAELDALRKEIGEAKAKERINEMNSAISEFSDTEKAYAQAEIDAFNANPVESEINSVVNKIWEGIGKAAKEHAKAASDAEITAEQNSANIEDIFSVIETPDDSDDCDIF